MDTTSHAGRDVTIPRLRQPGVRPCQGRHRPSDGRAEAGHPRRLPDRVSGLMDQTPWLVKEAYEHLDQLIEPDWTGWEWGAGGSTVWFGRRLVRLTSIEHDADWLHQVQARLTKWNLTNVDLRYIEKGPGYYEAYADAILAEPDGSLNLVCVDGRARVRCVQNAIAKVAPGGVLVVDNMTREYYREGTDKIPADWTLHSFEGWWNGPWLTRLWVRP